MSRRYRLSLLLFGWLLLVGCGRQPDPTPTSLAEPTEQPTLTPEPPEPTATAEPPATATSGSQEASTATSVVETPTPAADLSGKTLADGDAFLIESDWEGAEEVYNQLLIQNPEDAVAQARLAYLYVQRPETKQLAVAAAAGAVALDPDDLEIQAIHLLALTVNGLYEDATVVAESLNVLAYNHPFAQAIIAELYLYTGQYEQGSSLIQQAVALSGLSRGGISRDIFRVQIAYHLVSRQPDTALIAALNLKNQEPNFVPHYSPLAQAYQQGSRGVTFVQDTITAGLAIDPDFLPLLLLQAEVYLNTDDQSAAADLCETIAADYDVPDGGLCLGTIHRLQGGAERALAVYDDLESRFPTDYRIYLGRGLVAYELLDDCAAAENYFRTAVANNGYASEPYTYWGITQVCQAQYLEATDTLGIAIERDPFNALAYEYLGTAWLAQGEHELARDAYREALILNPAALPTVYAGYGEALFNLGACAAASDNLESWYICAGDTLTAVLRLELATNAYALALEENPNNAAALEGATIVYAQLRLCDIAGEYLVRLERVQSDIAAAQEAVNSCTLIIAPPDFDFETISERQAIAMMQPAVEAIPGVLAVNVAFEESDGDRVLVIGYAPDLSLPDLDVREQLAEIVFAVSEAFVLTETDPVALTVVAVNMDTGEPIDAAIVPYIAALFWYRGSFTDNAYRATWFDLQDLLDAAAAE